MKTEISILLVEEEDIWIKQLSSIISDFGSYVVNIAKTVEEALKAFDKHGYDIVLINSHIGNENGGIALGKIVHDIYNTPYILMTSGSGYDLKKISKPYFQLQKPINTNSLHAAINNAIEYHDEEKEEKHGPQPQSSTFFLKEGIVYTKLDWNDISHISAGKNYVSIFSAIDNREYFIRGSLQRTLQQLIPKELQDNFIQINRSQIVQFSHIKEITHDGVVTKFCTMHLSYTYSRELKARMTIV